MSHLFIEVHVHAEPQHALDAVSVGLGVGQLVAGAQGGGLEEHHGQVGRRLVVGVLLERGGTRRWKNMNKIIKVTRLANCQVLYG